MKFDYVVKVHSTSCQKMLIYDTACQTWETLATMWPQSDVDNNKVLSLFCAKPSSPIPTHLKSVLYFI